jgi:hypothetical protein
VEQAYLKGLGQNLHGKTEKKQNKFNWLLHKSNCLTVRIAVSGTTQNWWGYGK